MVADRTKARFLELADQGTGTFCWAWRGSKNPGGYGRLSGKLAHRLSWEIHHGEIPCGLFVCHRCDNPECCNPDHLFLGTAYDNNIDRCIKTKRVRVPSTFVLGINRHKHHDEDGGPVFVVSESPRGFEVRIRGEAAVHYFPTATEDGAAVRAREVYRRGRWDI